MQSKPLTPPSDKIRHVRSINGYQIGFTMEKRESFYLLPLLDYLLLLINDKFSEQITYYYEYDLSFEDGSLKFVVTSMVGDWTLYEATIAFAYKNFEIFKQVEDITIEQINPNGAYIRLSPTKTYPEGMKVAVDTGGLVRALQYFADTYEGNQFHLLDTLWGQGNIQVESMLIGNDGNHYKLLGRLKGAFGRVIFMLFCKEENTTIEMQGFDPAILFTDKPTMYTHL